MLPYLGKRTHRRRGEFVLDLEPGRPGRGGKVDAQAHGTLARFANHSSLAANVQMQSWCVCAFSLFIRGRRGMVECCAWTYRLGVLLAYVCVGTRALACMQESALFRFAGRNGYRPSVSGYEESRSR